MADRTHPVPFPLPEHKTQSGLRTRSSPGGTGSNELRFDDAAGAEPSDTCTHGAVAAKGAGA